MVRLSVAAFERGLDHPLVLLLVAEGLEADGRGDEALGLLAKGHGRGHGRRGRRLATLWRDVLARQGRLIQATREALETALLIDPDVYWTLILAGAVSFRSSDLKAAEGYYQRAAELAPDQAEPLAALAAIAARRDKPGRALALAERALADRAAP